MSGKIYTNSELATARQCLTKCDLRYNQHLTPDAANAEALDVGSAWHAAFDFAHKEGEHGAGYDAFRIHAPSRLWNEKLGRMFAAYEWYWKEQEFHVVESEHTFRTELNGIAFEGQLDGVIDIGGRRGVLERKTTSMGIEEGAMYWDRLQLDVQIGIYASAVGFVPSFILYDVARKPTINPKKVSRADVARLTMELKANGSASYFGQAFDAEALHIPLEEGKESISMYGARLTADIGDRPEYYFARREVARTKADFDSLIGNLSEQVKVVEHAERHGLMHRNPDACATFGQCEFFSLCSKNVRPLKGDPAPDGFHHREHRHPELAPNS